MRSLRRGFLSLALLWAACGTGPEFSTTRAQFLVTACESSDVPQGQQFRIQLHDSVQIVRAMTALQRPDSAAHMVVGRLAHGDGGFNAPWHWHLYPGRLSESGGRGVGFSARLFLSLDLSFGPSRLVIGGAA